MKSNNSLKVSYLLAGVSFMAICMLIGGLYVFNTFDYKKGIEVNTDRQPAIDLNINISRDSISDTSYRYIFKNSDNINLRVKKVK